MELMRGALDEATRSGSPAVAQTLVGAVQDVAELAGGLPPSTRGRELQVMLLLPSSPPRMQGRADRRSMSGCGVLSVFLLLVVAANSGFLHPKCCYDYLWEDMCFCGDLKSLGCKLDDNKLLLMQPFPMSC